MQEGEGLGARMLDILLRGVSTRQYQRVLPEMADTVGVSRSTVSRETTEAAAAELERLLNRGLVTRFRSFPQTLWVLRFSK